MCADTWQASQQATERVRAGRADHHSGDGDEQDRYGAHDQAEAARQHRPADDEQQRRGAPRAGGAGEELGAREGKGSASVRGESRRGEGGRCGPMTVTIAPRR